MEKFKTKYKISSARLKSWNYSWKGAYFITICTKNRTHYFGEIIDHKMQLSKIGVLANVMWYEIRNHVKNIEQGEFVIMPNHVHGVLVLKNNHNDCRDKACLVSTGSPPGTTPLISTPTNPSQKTGKSIGRKRFQNQGKNTVSSIIGSYKSAVTKYAHRLEHEFVWQSRFHDHIIRNEESFERITKYVINNPQNWETDKFYADV